MLQRFLGPLIQSTRHDCKPQQVEDTDYTALLFCFCFSAQQSRAAYCESVQWQRCWHGVTLWLPANWLTDWLVRPLNIRNLAWKFFAQHGRPVGWLVFSREGRCFLPCIVLSRKGWTGASWQLFPGGWGRNGCVGGWVCGEGVVRVASEYAFFCRLLVVSLVF